MEIRYTEEIPSGESLFELMEHLGWNRTGGSPALLRQTQEQSWAGIYAYDGETLVGAARIVSDGAATGFLNGLCVKPEYRNRGIAAHMVQVLLKKCETAGICTELFCAENLVSFYRRLGFEPFAVGMKKVPENG